MWIDRKVMVMKDSEGNQRLREILHGEDGRRAKAKAERHSGQGGLSLARNCSQAVGSAGMC